MTPAQPGYVFWANPSLIARGPEQEQWHRRSSSSWPISHGYNQLCAAAKERLDGSVATHRKPLLKDGLQRRAMELGSKAFGVTRVNPAHVFAGRQVNEPYAILLGLEERVEEIDKAPSLETNDEVMRIYYELGEIAIAVAATIRDHGYAARAHHPLGSGEVLVLPHAIQAGLGELGKHGSMLHAGQGSLLRLAMVTTDLELPLDGPIEVGLADVCSRCTACERACPPGAISSDKREVRGSLRYIVDLDRCLPYFIDNFGCAVCIKVCPWNQPRFATASLRHFAERAAR